MPRVLRNVVWAGDRVSNKARLRNASRLEEDGFLSFLLFFLLFWAHRRIGREQLTTYNNHGVGVKPLKMQGANEQCDSKCPQLVLISVNNTCESGERGELIARR